MVRVGDGVTKEEEAVETTEKMVAVKTSIGVRRGRVMRNECQR